MMGVPDYVLAVLGLLACLVWLLISTLFTIAPGFASRALTDEEERSQRRGCVSGVIAIMGTVYFAGVIIAGSWSWL